MRRLLTLVGLAVTLVGCNDSTSPSGSIAGSYALRTINGNRLPYTFPTTGLTVTSETKTLNSDGSYQVTARLSSGQSSSEIGVYFVNNNFIDFRDDTDGFTYSGSLSGSVLTEQFPSGNGFDVYVFDRN